MRAGLMTPGVIPSSLIMKSKVKLQFDLLETLMRKKAEYEWKQLKRNSGEKYIAGR